MAIGTNDAVHKFGTQDSIDDGTTSAITDGNFSVAADISAWTNDDDAPQAEIILQWQYPSGTISAGAGVNIYARLINIQGTNDANAPDASHPRKFLGRIKVDEGLSATTDEYTDPITVILPNTKSSQEYEFYFENDTGVSMSAGWAAWITPKTIGPHA